MPLLKFSGQAGVAADYAAAFAQCLTFAFRFVIERRSLSAILHRRYAGRIYFER
jgi:hypothetical protein